jgi:hypothetical protein
VLPLHHEAKREAKVKVRAANVNDFLRPFKDSWPSCVPGCAVSIRVRQVVWGLPALPESLLLAARMGVLWIADLANRGAAFCGEEQRCAEAEAERTGDHRAAHPNPVGEV